MRPSFEKSAGRIIKPHRYEWLWEPLETDRGFELRAMFGAKTVYLDGKLMFCCIAKKEPWRGMLVCTEHAHQASLVADFSELAPHSVLPKWLYLPESADSFERTATRLVELGRRRDPRIGVTPKPKRNKISNRTRQKLDSDRVEGPSPNGPRPVRRRALQKTKAPPTAAVGRKKRA